MTSHPTNVFSVAQFEYKGQTFLLVSGNGNCVDVFGLEDFKGTDLTGNLVFWGNFGGVSCGFDWKVPRNQSR